MDAVSADETQREVAAVKFRRALVELLSDIIRRELERGTFVRERDGMLRVAATAQTEISDPSIRDAPPRGKG